MSENDTSAAEIRDILLKDHKPGDEDLRIGIFLDRVESRAVAILLNTRNNRFAFLTKGERAIADSDDWDSVCDAVNEVCRDIRRWSEQEDEE